VQYRTLQLFKYARRRGATPCVMVALNTFNAGPIAWKLNMAGDVLPGLRLKSLVFGLQERILLSISPKISSCRHQKTGG
jgi:hypothetical protein